MLNTYTGKKTLSRLLALVYVKRTTLTKGNYAMNDLYVILNNFQIQPQEKYLLEHRLRAIKFEQNLLRSNYRIYRKSRYLETVFKCGNKSSVSAKLRTVEYRE